MKALIRKIPVFSILDDPHFGEIVQEYASEAKIAEMPDPKPDREAYQAMERFGILHSFGAFEADRMVGFVVILFSRLPHYSLPVANLESFYVLPEHRRYGTGARLLEAAEKLAQEKDYKHMLVTAPKDGRLSRALSPLGYRMSHEVFVRRLD